MQTAAFQSDDLLFQSERMQNTIVGNGTPILLVDHTEAAAVIPHRPANVVLLEGCANIIDPAGACFGVRVASVHAELVAGERNVMSFRPISGKPHLAGDAIAIPES